MPGLVEDIRAGYADICRHDGDDALRAYGEFDQLTTEERPDLEILRALPFRQHERALQAIQSMRGSLARLVDGQNPLYFRGSGMVVVGSSRGTFMAVDYQPGSTQDPTAADPVAEKHGPYYHVAVRKMAFGAALGRLDLHHCSLDFRYMREREYLAKLGLDTKTDPRHIGHAVVHEASGGFLAAGASGMLPSPSVDRRWQQGDGRLMNILAAGRKRGWYSWPGDAAAGFHDEVAAICTLDNMLYPPEPNNFAPVLEKGDIIFARTGTFRVASPNVNIH